ncbi:putative integrase [Sulfuracidifex metallicus]|nr:putative integrase [Sulfuracidifex metallicus]
MKGKYYVYIIENESGSKQRHHYVGSLEKVIERPTP